MSFSVINFYKFVQIDDAKALRYPWRDEARRLGLLGTILLAPEGINCALAGEANALEAFLGYLKSDVRFADVVPKWSETPKRPFRRMEVKVKRWIIRFAEASDPSVAAILGGDRMSPAELKAALEEQAGDFIVVDTRNAYETDVGAFTGAVRLPIKTFTEFPDAFLAALGDQRDKQIVFYCTGGVRCEKVVPWAKAHGFERATQLDGGILRYFEEQGSAHYEGDCFVFDDRFQVDGALRVTT
ncbi:MAG: sulfurtransferase [Deltaproteobacteria bacterium]|nr:sulfurtransferase [Deltaproteobacteria bacterium]